MNKKTLNFLNKNIWQTQKKKKALSGGIKRKTAIKKNKKTHDKKNKTKNEENSAHQEKMGFKKKQG